MKPLNLLSILLLALLITTSCKKKEETPILDATAEEAASIMASSLCTDGEGALSQVEDAILLADQARLKSVMYDSSFTITSVPGAPITYSYQMNYHWGFQNPNLFELSYESSGSYASPYVSASITGNGNVLVSGIMAGDSYVCSGQSQRDGTFTMKVGNKNAVTGQVTIDYTNFRINKATGILESGNATMSVEGKTSGGLSFGFTGTFVYEGNYTGSLTINSKKFYINIQTGVVQ